jgi:L-ascorbate 6-phosphate lactonase
MSSLVANVDKANSYQANTAPMPLPAHSSAYCFTANDPFDRESPIRYVVPRLMESAEYMRTIRSFAVKRGELAIWYMGQNGFMLKDASGLLLGIDLYMTDSCAATFAHLPFRLDRQLPVFIEPEDLDVDVFLTTHSHQDHADPETIRRMPKAATSFVGPYDSLRIYRENGVAEEQMRIIHPGQSLELSSDVQVTATFAFPTDTTDLNHTGVLIEFASGIRFYNTGDTAYAEGLAALLPTHVDVCAICINGGFHNLTHQQAAAMIMAIEPRVAIPCHYDMMVNNVGSPEMFQVALQRADAKAKFAMLRYYEPWMYRRDEDFESMSRKR